MNTTYHNEYPADQTAMQAMRAELRLHPALEFGPEARPVFDELIARTSAAQNVSYEAATVGGVPGWWCRPSNAIEGVAILYLHGGAYILGSAAAYRNFAGQIAARAKAAAFIADYRLAPEHRFPGAVNDGIAAYRGLSEGGYSRLALVGDSAGGGLAPSLLLLATAASKTGSVLQPAAAAVMSPWTDLALTGDSIATRSSADPLLMRDALEKAAQLYLGEQDLHDPQTSPLYGDLTGLPRYVSTSEKTKCCSMILAASLNASALLAAPHNSMFGRVWCTSFPPILSCFRLPGRLWTT
jgi:acetyl esterase/lipase